MARLLRLAPVSPPNQQLPLPHQHLLRTVLVQATRRCFSGSVVLEESSTSTHVSNGVSSSSAFGGEKKQGENAHAETACGNQIATSEKPPSNATDDLSSLILSKLRGKTPSPTSQKDVVHTASQPSNATLTSMISSTSTSTDNKSIDDSKWAQVMSSIRKIAAKNKAAEATSKPDTAKIKDKDDGDDFADLDLPDPRKDPSPFRSQNRNSLANAFTKDYNPNIKNQKGYQPGNQHRSKDIKPGNFQFLKSRDSNGSFNRMDTLGDRSAVDRSFGSTKDPFSNGRSKESWNQQANKDVKPVSFDFLNTPQTKATCIQEDVSMPNISEAGQPTKDNIVPFSGYTVCIQGVPAHSNLGLVKHLLSTHGEVVSCFRKPTSNGLCTIYIEFKTAEAMDNALTLREIKVEGKLVSIVRADHPITTVVRISRVSAETPESLIRSICEKYGKVDNIKRRGNGFYDVFYKVKELPNISKIIESLNEVTLNQRRWVALLAPTLHPAAKQEVLKTSEGKAWLASQINHMLNKIEAGLDAMSICFEDLKALTQDEVSNK